MLPIVMTLDEIALADLRDLAFRTKSSHRGMTREQINALDVFARAARTDRLLGDPRDWTILDIAEAFGVTRDAVAKWRRNFLRTGKASANALPEPENPGGWSPWWYARDIRRWGVQCGRMDENLIPRPRRPPGRTPKPRDDDEVDLWPTPDPQVTRAGSDATLDPRVTRAGSDAALDEVAAVLKRRPAA